MRRWIFSIAKEGKEELTDEKQGETEWLVINRVGA